VNLKVSTVLLWILSDCFFLGDIVFEFTSHI
jgi:hypothetical protein